MKTQIINGFVIFKFSVCQGEIYNLTECERFYSYKAALGYKERNYKDEGHFWSGLKEFKIIELQDGELKNAFGCNSPHLQYLERYITQGGLEAEVSGFRL